VVFVSKNATSSTWNVFGSHTYSEKGSFNVQVTVTDDDGNTVTTGQAAANTVTFLVLDAALTDTTSTTGPYSYTTTEGHSIPGGPVLVATFADNNPSAPISDFPSTNLLIDWGDGTPTTQGTVTFLGASATQSFWGVLGDHTYGEPTGSPYSVKVHVTDVDGSAIITSGTTVFVNDEVLSDITPQAPGQAEYDPVEGNSSGNQIVATFTDNNPNAPASDFPSSNLVINWGDNTTSNGTIQLVSRSSSISTWNVIGSHTYAELGQFNISVTITDVDGSTLTTPSGAGTQVVEDVQDAPLTDATPNQTFTAVEGNSTGTIVVAVFNDHNPSAPASDFGNGLPTPNLLIDWGDSTTSNGSIVQIAPSAAGVSTWEVLGSHTYDDFGTFSVHVMVTDADGAILPTTNGTHINVADAALADVAVQTTYNACANTSTGSQVVATFTDNNPFATSSDFSAVIHWGDNTTSFVGSGAFSEVGFNPPTNSTWNLNAGHTYLHAGIFNVSVTIMDEDGATLNTPATGANQITFNVGPNNMLFTTMPPTVVSGKPFTVVVTGYDNALDTQVSTGYNGPITLSIKPGTGPVGGHLGGTLTVFAINGVATFNNLTLDKATPPPYHLRATSNCGFSDSSPAGIEVTASNMVVTSDTLIPKPGIPFKITFTAVDSTGATATNYNSMVDLMITQTPLHGMVSANGGPYMPNGSNLGTFAITSGKGTVTLKFNNPGTYTISWATTDGLFSGSFTWSYGRRLNFSTTFRHT
jgi:hypothetical protein